MSADLVPGVDDHLHLLGEGLDGVTGDEPGGLHIALLEEVQEPQRPDLSGEQTPRDVVRRVFAPVGAEPARHRINVHTKGTEYLFLRQLLPLSPLSPIRSYPERVFDAIKVERWRGAVRAPR